MGIGIGWSHLRRRRATTLLLLAVRAEDVLGGLVAVHVGHPEVHEDDVDGSLAACGAIDAHLVHGLDAVVRLVDAAVAQLAQHVDEEFAIDGVVFDDEEGEGVFFGESAVEGGGCFG